MSHHHYVRDHLESSSTSEASGRTRIEERRPDHDHCASDQCRDEDGTVSLGDGGTSHMSEALSGSHGPQPVDTGTELSTLPGFPMAVSLQAASSSRSLISTSTAPRR
jgi:hypothetical protein